MAPTRMRPVVLIGIAGMLSLAALLLVLGSMGEEPFLRVRVRDVVEQVIAPVVVIVLLLELIVYDVISIAHREEARVNAWVLAWCLFVLFWLVQVPAIYVTDVVKFQPH